MNTETYVSNLAQLADHRGDNNAAMALLQYAGLCAIVEAIKDNTRAIKLVSAAICSPIIYSGSDPDFPDTAGIAPETETVETETDTQTGTVLDTPTQDATEPIAEPEEKHKAVRASKARTEL
jgi:hypothetical protein